MEHKVVLGSLFGDEGKGMTVNWLCKRAIEQGKTCSVVRMCNGPQAGHTVVENGIRHIFSSFGSGTLLGIPTVYTDSAYIDPICMLNEYKILLENGIIPRFSCTLARIITPYDVIANRQDVQNLKDGTCGKGTYKAVQRPFQVLFGQFISNNTVRSFLVYSFLRKVRLYYGLKKEKKLEDLFYYSIEELIKLQDITLNTEIFDVQIYESTQGLLLDANKGFIPHVTATSIVPDFNFLSEHTDVYLICRSYLTRHGNFGNSIQLKEIPYPVKKDYTNVWNEYQGKFYKGLFSIDLLKDAFNRHHLKDFNVRYNLVITHCDDIRDDFSYLMNYNVKKGSLRSFIQDIEKSIDIPFKHIYTNSSEQSNLLRYE